LEVRGPNDLVVIRINMATYKSLFVSEATWQLR
jgi:hypothetical protein